MIVTICLHLKRLLGSQPILKINQFARLISALAILTVLTETNRKTSVIGIACQPGFREPVLRIPWLVDRMGKHLILDITTGKGLQQFFKLKVV